MTRETLPQGGNPTTADEEEHGNSAVPQYVGHYWGLGRECYMVWWLHSFHKLQQWTAFRVIVVVKPGSRLSAPPCCHTAETGPLLSYLSIRK